MNQEREQPSFSENRSIPPSAVFPVLAYSDARKAADWLCRAFGFVERLRIANHRAQLSVGGYVIVTDGAADAHASAGIAHDHSVMVRVADVDRHCERAKQFGARIINPPTDYLIGERQYTVEDLGGHRWTFTQTIADADPKEWGGELFE